MIAAGPGNTEQQLEVIQTLKPTVYVGVPDYLKILLDKAKETGKDATSFKKAMVGGGALFPSLRAEYKQRGVATFQTYATADLGIIAYESPALEGMIVDEGVIVEIVRPGTGDPVPAGEVGEVVVTSFNRDYPMIRFATGDLSAVLPGASPCGRTNMRIKGWLGRADQTTKVKGMFVHPEQVAEVAKRHAGVGRVRLVVGRAGEQDTMTLRAEAQRRCRPEGQAGRDAAGRHQAQGRGGDRRTGLAAQRRQGHRRRADVYVSWHTRTVSPGMRLRPEEPGTSGAEDGTARLFAAPRSRYELGAFRDEQSLDHLVARQGIDLARAVAEQARQHLARVLAERGRRRVGIERRAAQVHGTLDGFHHAGAGMLHLRDHAARLQHLALAHLADGADGAARHAGLVQALQPLVARALLDQRP